MNLLKASIILTLLFPLTSFGQRISEDSLLQKVVNELPDGWSASITDTTFTIEFQDSTWEMHGNWINAHDEVWDLKRDSVWIKTNGRKVKMRYEFKLIDKLSPDKFEKLKKKPTYSGRWAHLLYNSEKYTLLQKSRPALDDEYNTLWPKKTGVWKVYSLMNEVLPAVRNEK